jgi:integrase
MPEQLTEVFDKMIPQKPEDLIFPGPGGKPFRQIPRVFNRVVDRLGFNSGITDRRERVTFHTLRHTAASLGIQAGVDLYTVKEVLGHSTIALTERYSHLANRALKEAATKMGALIKNNAGSTKPMKHRDGLKGAERGPS